METVRPPQEELIGPHTLLRRELRDIYRSGTTPEILGAFNSAFSQIADEKPGLGMVDLYTEFGKAVPEMTQGRRRLLAEEAGWPDQDKAKIARQAFLFASMPNIIAAVQPFLTKNFRRNEEVVHSAMQEVFENTANFSLQNDIALAIQDKAVSGARRFIRNRGMEDVISLDRKVRPFTREASTETPVFREVARREFKERVEAVLEAFDLETNKRVIELRFGFEGGNGMILEDIGARLEPKVTRERVRQRQNVALSRLRSPYRNKTIDGFLEDQDLQPVVWPFPPAAPESDLRKQQYLHDANRFAEKKREDAAVILANKYAPPIQVETRIESIARNQGMDTSVAPEMTDEIQKRLIELSGSQRLDHTELALEVARSSGAYVDEEVLKRYIVEAGKRRFHDMQIAGPMAKTLVTNLNDYLQDLSENGQDSFVHLRLSSGTRHYIKSYGGDRSLWNESATFGLDPRKISDLKIIMDHLGTETIRYIIGMGPGRTEEINGAIQEFEELRRFSPR